MVGEDGKIKTETKTAELPPSVASVTVDHLKKGYVDGSFNLSGYTNKITSNTEFTITIKDVISGDYTLPIKQSYRFKLGGNDEKNY